MIVLFFVCSLLFSFSSGDSSIGKSGSTKLEGKLIFAHILFRHGDRTPEHPYPLDPWKDESQWPTGFGQLTNIGKNQVYQLGKWLSKRYASLTNSTYSHKTIYVQSTDIDRTLMSAQSNLAGFSPPKKPQVWNKDILWQPIPVHTVPIKFDNLLAGTKPCPAYQEELDKLLSSEEFRTLNKRFSYLYEYLTEHTGKTVKTFYDVYSINDTLRIEVLYNKSLPIWTKKVFPSEDMSYAANLYFQMFTYTRKLARLKTGPLLKEILTRFSEKIEQTLKPNRSLWMYSAHDITIVQLLKALKMYQLQQPPYASALLLEMRISENKPLISIFFKNSTEDPEPMEIPHCGIQCPLTKLYELYSDVIPENWDSECQIQKSFSDYFIFNEEGRFSTKNIVIIVVLVVILVAMMILLGNACYRRRSYFRVLVK